MRDQIANLLQIWNMESGAISERKYLPIIIVGRKQGKGIDCYFITPEYLNKHKEINLNTLPFLPIVKKELLVNWLLAEEVGLTPLSYLLEGQV